MSSVPIHPRPKTHAGLSSANPLPQLLQTPSGLAILELQGTINVPESEGIVDAAFGKDEQGSAISIGRLNFPDFNPNALDPSNTAWMKRVYLYVGQHQRLTGEVKKLPKPLAVVRRRGLAGGRADAVVESPEVAAEELDVVEVVKYKLVFSQRPEPVTKTA
jgi:chromosome transmission fidelity protein 8